MEKNETILEMARQIIEDFNNHNIEQSFFPQENKELFTNFILCSIPIWARPLDIIREWQDISQEERIENYLLENGMYSDMEEDEDEDSYTEDMIDMMMVDNCKNSEFIIGAMWEFDGDIDEFWINGNNEEELTKSIVKNFKEYQEEVKRFKNKFKH